MINTKNQHVYSTLTFDSQPESQLAFGRSVSGRAAGVCVGSGRSQGADPDHHPGQHHPAGRHADGGGPAASNGAVTGVVNFTDTDGDALTYSVQTRPPAR